MDSEKSGTAAVLSDRRSANRSIFAACFFAIGTLFYENGFILMYLMAMGVKEDRVIAYLVFPNIAKMLVMIPVAHYVSRLGMVKSSVLGNSICTVSMVCLLCTPFLIPYHKEWILIVSAMILEGVGCSLHLTAWFPLASSFVAEKERGSFFSRLRLFYQTSSIVFMFIAIGVYKQMPSIMTFQVFLLLAIGGKVFGTAVFSMLPDRVPRRRPGDGEGMLKSLLYAIGAPGYMPFCAYVFLLFIAVGSCTSLFRLMAKVSLGFSENEVLLLGNLGTVGAFIGLIIGGRMVDRIGTKPVFLICHFSFASILIGFLGRIFVGEIFVLPLICLLSIGFGAVQAASSIGVATEMLNLLPSRNKSMATALNMVLLNLGIGLSGIISSLSVKLNVFNDSWTIWGSRMNQYDTMLLACGLMVLILTVTLGLVPSVVKKIQWYVS